MGTEELIGEVTHYFGHVNAVVIKLTKDLVQGQTVHFKGHSTDFSQPISSMQLDHKPITQATAGQDVGVGVNERVRVGDKVYLVI